jgi:superfamily I DNA/RNA helicase
MNGYRLVRRELSPAQCLAALPAPPVLDATQQRVVDHKGGPLLVLAGPGTGKTTTIVAAVAERIERRGIDPSRILVLTFSRKAAGELRDRITARLGRTTVAVGEKNGVQLALLGQPGHLHVVTDVVA